MSTEFNPIRDKMQYTDNAGVIDFNQAIKFVHNSNKMNNRRIVQRSQVICKNDAKGAFEGSLLRLPLYLSRMRILYGCLPITTTYTPGVNGRTCSLARKSKVCILSVSMLQM